MTRKRVRKLEGFLADIKEYKQRILPARLVAFQKWIALKLYELILKKTPVGEGTLRGAWTISIGAQDKSAANRKSGAGQGSALTLAEKVIFAAAVNKMAEAKYGQIIWINNAMPYVLRIEFDGHSKEKAPKGMVQISINELKNWLKTSKSEFVKITKRSF